MLTGRYFVKKCLHKQFVSQNGGTLGYKYLCRMKDHCSTLECMPSFFSYNLHLRAKSRSFFAHMTIFCKKWIFCKKCLHKQLFRKMVEDRDINIYAVEKTTVVPLSVCRAFLVIMCICLTNHVLLWFNQGEFLSRNPDKSNFFSKWPNAQV